MAAKAIINTVKRYAKHIGAHYPVKRVILYGSFSRGTQRRHSDIDVAVFLSKQPTDVLRAEADLCRLGMEIDVRIEPILADEKHDPSGFYQEISRHGTVVYRSGAEG